MQHRKKVAKTIVNRKKYCKSHDDGEEYSLEENSNQSNKQSISLSERRQEENQEEEEDQKNIDVLSTEVPDFNISVIRKHFKN